MVVVMGSTLFAVDNYRVWPQGAWSTAGAWGGGGNAVDFPPDQIMHWHGEHPLDPRIGLSMLDTIRDVIAEDAALQQATVELANNGLQEPTWVFRPADAPDWTPTASRNFEEDLRNRMRRRNERPIVLEEGMELRSFGVTPRDAQMMAIRQWAIERVAALYGVPLGMVGLDPNVAAAQSEFYSDTLPPYCADFTRMLDKRLMVQVYNETDYEFEFNLDDKLMSQDDRLRALTSATGRAVMLTNEARAKLNLPPVDGGDELVTPLNTVVGDNPKPSPAVMPVQNPNAPPQDGSYRTDQPPPPLAPKTPKALGKQYPPLGGAQPVEPDGGEFAPLPQLLPRRAAEMERQRRNVDVTQAVLQKHFNRLDRVLRTKGRTDWSRWDRELADDINHALTGIVQAEGDIYTLRLAGDKNFDMGQVRHYLAAMADGAATAINDTTRSEIDAMGIDDAMARTPQHVASAGTSLGARATMWAREQAAVQAPGYEQRVKSWIADTGRHAQFDGDTVAIADDWPSGFAPGSAPGCACSMSVT
jgi:hypothetical protein